jgi:glutamate synthase (NADPH/NADH) large chain
VWNENTIIGNTCLYGATAGELFAAGQAGERFAVRNSGATAVVEGCGANGCEYMTGGTVVILGAVGDNFGAGFTGGHAFVYDADDNFELRVNPDTLVWSRVSHPHWEGVLCDLIARHVAETGSRFAARLLNEWATERGRFWHVVPKEYVKYLPVPMAKTDAVAAE